MHGFLLVDKPLFLSSFDVIRKLNRQFMIGRSGRKIGHGGTLDPLATGLMVIAIGKATRLLTYFLGSDKRYIAGVALGSRTSTDDNEGEVIATAAIDRITRMDVERALLNFHGKIAQIPPAYSAVHVDGVRAYHRVRNGQNVEMPARDVEISRIDLLRCDLPGDNVISLDIACSGGTYIRSVARDLGTALHTEAHLASLRRTEACHFHIEQAHTLDFLLQQENIDDWLIPCNRALNHLPCIIVSENTVTRLFDGQPVSIRTPSDGIYRIQTSKNGELNAILTRKHHEKDAFLRFSPISSDNV